MSLTVLWRHRKAEMATCTGSDSPAAVQLQVSWNAPEAYVTLDSDGTYELKTVPDVLGLHARQPGAEVIKVLLGRDSRSVRALVPDVKVLEWGFHDVTLLDMGDITGPDVSMAELSLLRMQWPVPVVSSMAHLQPELEQLRHVCKKRYHGTQADMCSFCGKRIRLDMSRHVAKYHLDLAQLWRRPVSWCIIWKGTPQYCMNHLRLAHAVPATVKTANLGKWFPPWTVKRQTWCDALNPRISGVSMDVLLFSECGAPLIHHYRVFGRGVSYISLRGSYITNLRTFITKQLKFFCKNYVCY